MSRITCKELAEMLLAVDQQRPGLEVVFNTGDREHTVWGVDFCGTKYVEDPDYHTDHENKRFFISLYDKKDELHR